MVDGATSVLDSMTADTTSRKRAEGTVLTPVGTEKASSQPRISDEVSFLGQEAVEGVIRSLRAAAASANRHADELEAGLGITPEQKSKAAHDLEVKLMEREADRMAADRTAAEGGDKKAQKRVESTSEAEFGERWARLSAEAQASAFSGDLVPAAKEVFGSDLADADAPAQGEPAPVSGSVVPGWVCPTHGDEAILDTKSRKGREYRLCTICKQFEKE